MAEHCVTSNTTQTLAREVPVARALRSWKTDFEKSLTRVSSLKPGWDGGKGAAPSQRSITLAKLAAELALSSTNNPLAPFVVPVQDGGIQLEWHRAAIEFEIYIGPRGEMTALLEIPGHGVEIEKSGEEALDLFLRWAPRFAAPSGNEDYEVISKRSPVFALAA